VKILAYSISPRASLLPGTSTPEQSRPPLDLRPQASLLLAVRACRPPLAFPALPVSLHRHQPPCQVLRQGPGPSLPPPQPLQVAVYLVQPASPPRPVVQHLVPDPFHLLRLAQLQAVLAAPRVCLPHPVLRLRAPQVVLQASRPRQVRPYRAALLGLPAFRLPLAPPQVHRPQRVRLKARNGYSPATGSLTSSPLVSGFYRGTARYRRSKARLPGLHR